MAGGLQEGSDACCPVGVCIPHFFCMDWFLLMVL